MRKIYLAGLLLIVLGLVSCSKQQYSLDNEFFSSQDDFFIHLPSKIKISRKTDFFEVYGLSNIKPNGEDVAISFRGIEIDIEGTIFIYKSDEDIMGSVKSFIAYNEKNKKNYEYISGKHVVFSDIEGLLSVVSFDDKYNSYFKKRLISAIILIRADDWVIKYRTTQPLSNLESSVKLYKNNNTDLIKELQKMIVVNLAYDRK